MREIIGQSTCNRTHLCDIFIHGAEGRSPSINFSFERADLSADSSSAKTVARMPDDTISRFIDSARECRTDVRNNETCACPVMTASDTTKLSCDIAVYYH